MLEHLKSFINVLTVLLFIVVLTCQKPSTWHCRRE